MILDKVDVLEGDCRKLAMRERTKKKQEEMENRVVSR
jgi:hypothetical protein